MTSFNQALGLKAKKTRKNKKNGFTLIELMVGVGVVGVLTAVALPEMTKVLEKGKQSAAETTLTSAAKQCSIDLILELPTNDLTYDASNFTVTDNGTDIAVTGNCAAGTTLSLANVNGKTYEIKFTGNTPGKVTSEAAST